MYTSYLLPPAGVGSLCSPPATHNLAYLQYNKIHIYQLERKMKALVNQLKREVKILAYQLERDEDPGVPA